MQLQKLFENLAKKASIDITDAEFRTALESIKEIQIKDEIASEMESKLFDVETAKSNFEIKKHFTALALNGVDSELRTVIDEILADNEDVRNELYGEKSTPKRVSIAIRKIKELTETKSKAEGKGDDGKAAKAQEQIDKIVSEFKLKESNLLQQVSDKEKEKIDAITSLKKEVFFSGLKFANEFDLETNLLISEQKINKALIEKGAKMVYNQQTGKFEIKRVDDESLDYFDERNNKTSYEEFAKGVLTQNKLLAVSDSDAGKQHQQQPLQQEKTDSSGIKIDTSLFDKSVDEAISYQN